VEPPPGAVAADPGATRWPCPSSREAIWYPMASGVVSTKNGPAAAERGDGDPRSTVPAPGVTQARVSTRDATIASPWAARSVPAALG